MPATATTSKPFQPRPADANGSVSWIHIGDLHMVRSGEQNDIDLGRIVDAINAAYLTGVSFVYLPGDIADDGSAAAYKVVRSHLDRLKLPWCGIVGDHDVHEKSFTNFRTYIDEDLTGAFTVGRYRFLRLNAFSEPRPDAFIVDPQQLQWVEDELRACEEGGLHAILLLHCYPSDLKQGGSRLTELLRRYPALLVDMGHTHYNELSNDGSTLYSATRSTGQIEEGPVGFSVATVDADTVSWHFVQPDAPELVAITAPADRRLRLNSAEQQTGDVEVHAKVWSREAVQTVKATLHGKTVPLTRQAGVVWSGTIPATSLADGQHRLRVEATAANGTTFGSAIELVRGATAAAEFAATDQDNAVGAWEERGILGTQLGPNKNGKKW